MNKIKWVLLDFDGTLVNSLDLLFKIYQDFMNEENLPSSKEEFNELNGPNIQEIVSIIKSKYNLDMSITELYTRYLDKVKKFYTEVIPFDYSLKLLEILNNSYNLALVTSTNHDIIDNFLNQYKWKNFFSIIITGDNVTKSKPHPEIYLKCLHEGNIAKNSVVAIEDSLNGVKSATDAGIKSIQIDHNKLKLSDIPHILQEYESK